MLSKVKLNEIIEKNYDEILLYIEPAIKYILIDRHCLNEYNKEYKTINDLATVNIEYGKTEDYYIDYLRKEILNFIVNNISKSNKLDKLDITDIKYIKYELLEKIKTEKIEQLMILNKLRRA